jgi:succinate dehydrogenase / fumarate reductase membrane anchor subunit
MVKSVLSVAHRGLRDWMLQRVSAVLLAAYSIGLVAFVVCHPELSYGEWHALFAENWMKVATLLTLFFLLVHAWVGMWTIFTDYVKCTALRSLLHVVVLLTLAACLLWGFLILWSV